MCSMFLIISCDKAEIQKSQKDNSEITSRTDDCDDCPVLDCCCSITYVSGDAAELEICGSTGNRLSTTTCGPVDPPGNDCPNVSATYYLGPFQLDGNNTRELFCVPENASFMINVLQRNTVVSITCQQGQTSPQTVTPTLVFGNRYFFETNGDCELDTCPN